MARGLLPTPVLQAPLLVGTGTAIILYRLSNRKTKWQAILSQGCPHLLQSGPVHAVNCIDIYSIYDAGFDSIDQSQSASMHELRYEASFGFGPHVSHDSLWEKKWNVWDVAPSVVRQCLYGRWAHASRPPLHRNFDMCQPGRRARRVARCIGAPRVDVIAWPTEARGNPLAVSHTRRALD